MITVLGPTATGKTTFAAHLAARLNGEIISADSRQVYKGMDLATGKDIEDYIIEGKSIPYHLVDIVDPGYEYNVYEFQKDFLMIYEDIDKRDKLPILCGGTGMYIESVLKGYKLIKVPENKQLKEELAGLSQHELVARLQEFKVPHNTSDTEDIKRLIRAIEIQTFYKEHPDVDRSFPKIENIIFGMKFEREIIRKRITERLQSRLDSGMLNEVRELLAKGLTPEQLKFYGLEYKYLTMHITGEISFDEMFKLLNTAIHQFAKRQMTWFRKMERSGYKIHWIDGNWSLDKKVKVALQSLER